MSRVGMVKWLALWERGVPCSPRARRRELLIAAGTPGGQAADQLLVGEANARLLHLHVAMFGSLLACSTTCPVCGEALELEIDANKLLMQQPNPPAEPLQFQVADWEVLFRLATEADIDALQEEPALADARELLLRRCVCECRRGAEPMNLSMMPPEVTEQLEARLEALDPLAVLDFDLQCGSCGHEWLAALEVDAFLWARLDVWARRLLQDVHALARVYGWREREILAMSAAKRQIYLDLVSG